MHQHNVHGHAMQPRRKRRLATEGSNLSEQLQESLLRQIFRFGGVRRHPQAQRIHAPLMQVVEKLESFRIPLLGFFDRLRFGDPGALRMLSVGQVAFPGRMLSDAAKYLYVVLVAARFGMATCPFVAYQNNKTHCSSCLCKLPFLEVTFVTAISAQPSFFGSRQFLL